MKTATSILAVMVLLAVAALSVPGTLADESPALPTSLPSHYEKTWSPRRALRAMDSPQQGPPGDGKKKNHHHNTKDAGNKEAPHSHRALGHVPLVTPASTSTGNLKPTPAPTKPHKPKVTPANTKATSVPKKPNAPPVGKNYGPVH